MVHNKQGIDMLYGRIWTKVLRFALPVARPAFWNNSSTHPAS